MSRAYYCTVEELNERGRDNIPDQFRSNMHLIYSSPATLAFNSPGAEGFGVKRAGLAVPDSIMLIVAPGCCGRNTSLISSMREYDNRFFYLMMDETDIVTGRHLKKIPKAVEEICNSLDKKPSVVMICITCVDALLGTDMERVCRKAEEKTGLPVRPCYMYALTREGRKPPMVHVRQSLYSLLEPTKKKGNVVNLLGFFSPLVDDCELYDLLHSAGIKTIHEISRCRDFEEYKTMSEANFNLVLHQESRFAAEDFNDRLKIPFIELRRLYQTDKIQGIYIPYWTFDADTSTNYSAMGGIDYEVEYTDDKGERHTRIETRWYPTSGHINHFFDDVLVRASNKLSDTLLEWIEPYNTKAVASYSPDYMSGFCSEIYTIDLDDAHREAMDKMTRDIHYMAERDVLMRYDRVYGVKLRTSYYDETYKYIFIPVYSTAYMYKDKHYNVLINGETGKIKGEYPKSPIKIAAIIIVILGILFGIYLASSHEDTSYNDKSQKIQYSDSIDYKTFAFSIEEEMF